MKFKKTIAIIFAALVITAVVQCFTAVTVAPTPVFAQENVEFYGVPPPEDKSAAPSRWECLAGWKDFLFATLGGGLEDFYDYGRDLYIGLRWPMYYADIANVEDQLNRSRYAVMEAFGRCDINRMKSVTDAYYKLEAELYFVRHYVDASGGVIRSRMGTERGTFARQMNEYLAWRKKSENPNEDLARFEGYFNSFSSKYKSRIEQYTSYTSDPIYGDLIERWDELVKTLRTFDKLGREIGELSHETAGAVAEGGTALYKGGAAFYNSPGSALKSVGKAIRNTFQVCPTTSGYADKWQECVTFDEAALYGLGEAWDATKAVGETAWDITKGVGKTVVGVGESAVNIILEALSSKKTPLEEGAKISQKVAEIAEDNEEKTDLLTRYELLYGRVNGQGIYDVLSRVDEFTAVLSEGRAADRNTGAEEIRGSFAALDTIKKCAGHVRGNVCK